VSGVGGGNALFAFLLRRSILFSISSDWMELI